MSAYLVSQPHIAVLVEAIFRYEVPLEPPLEPDPLGQLLWDANSASVAYLYQVPLIIVTYAHGLSDEHKALVHDRWAVLKLCRGYQYQACEHPGWGTSLACQAAEALERQLLTHLGLTAVPFTDRRYRDAPWDLL